MAEENSGALSGISERRTTLDARKDPLADF